MPFDSNKANKIRSRQAETEIHIWSAHTEREICLYVLLNQTSVAFIRENYFGVCTCFVRPLSLSRCECEILLLAVPSYLFRFSPLSLSLSFHLLLQLEFIPFLWKFNSIQVSLPIGMNRAKNVPGLLNMYIYYIFICHDIRIYRSKFLCLCIYITISI